jgi:hypothetical protein
VPLRH